MIEASNPAADHSWSTGGSPTAKPDFGHATQVCAHLLISMPTNRYTTKTPEYLYNLSERRPELQFLPSCVNLLIKKLHVIQSATISRHIWDIHDCRGIPQTHNAHVSHPNESFFHIGCHKDGTKLQLEKNKNSHTILRDPEIWLNLNALHWSLLHSPISCEQTNLQQSVEAKLIKPVRARVQNHKFLWIMWPT